MNRGAMRALRKEILVLQGEQLRMALRHEIGNPSAGASSLKNEAWLEGVGSLIGGLLPVKWGRWVSIALGVWRISKRLTALVPNLEREGSAQQ